MTDPKIQPANITKPMQLLAAWLVGLLAIDSCFLFAAARMPPNSIEVAALTWAAIANVPLFLGALFLLQTRFRPELQEDLYYSTYISQKTNLTVSVPREDQRLATVLGRIEKLENLMLSSTAEIFQTENEVRIGSLQFGINKYLDDKDELSRKLLDSGAKFHTWFGGKTPPTSRVVAISLHLPIETRIIIIEIIEKLGFHHYNLFDNQLQEIEEDVLIGAYGPANQELPRMAV